MTVNSSIASELTDAATQIAAAQARIAAVLRCTTISEAHADLVALRSAIDIEAARVVRLQADNV